MAKKKQKKKTMKKPIKAASEPQVKGFLDLIAPGAVKFNTDHYILGNSYHTTIALRGYPASTEELALLRHVGEKSGVTLSVYTRRVTPAEEKVILQNASNKNRLARSNTNDIKESVTAEGNLQDMASMVSAMRRSPEPLLHCSVFIDLSARDLVSLFVLRDNVLAELMRSKLTADRVFLRQREGFMAANPAGHNVFGTQYERVLPSSSVANLYPFNYSGKTDPHGFYLGRDKYGSNIIVDFSKRDDDKTSDSVLILGNSGQGKSYLLKLILCNLLEAGKNVICLDPEHELVDLSFALNGNFVDLMSGDYLINIMQPKRWDDGSGSDDSDAPAAFRKKSVLSQHISFLRDVFRAYKPSFTDRHIDVLEIMICQLYSEWGMTEETDFASFPNDQCPVVADLYEHIDAAYLNYNAEVNYLYPKEILQDLLLGLHSMCKGADAKYFNGHTNITSERFLVFGVKDLLNASPNLRAALLFNILSYLSDRLLTLGNTVATLDELYIWLSHMTTIEYIRNTLKRVRKKESALILASQNLEDFDVSGIRELTRPLFSIPPHQFIFNGGTINKRFYMDNLQLEPSEYELIRFAQRGTCLYKCGNERYLLEVHAPWYKEQLFGNAGGA